MTPDAVERWWQIDAIFAEALDVPPDERAAFLDEACADDEDMRREVERLLEADEQAEQVRKDPADWFEAPPLPSPDVAAERDHEVSAANGKQVGPYRLLDEIGRGGMGTV